MKYLALALLISSSPASAHTWGDVDCRLVEEFMANESYGNAVQDIRLLSLTLRGVDYAAYARIEDQLTTKTQHLDEPDPVTRRMIALLLDRCG